MNRCEGWKAHVSVAVANVVDGVADGGIGVGVDGYLRTGTLSGALDGALVGAGLGGGIAGIGSGMSLAAAKWRGALACFSAGTPLLTPDGSKPIEAFRRGDRILSGDKYDRHPVAPARGRPNPSVRCYPAKNSDWPARSSPRRWGKTSTAGRDVWMTDGPGSVVS